MIVISKKIPSVFPGNHLKANDATRSFYRGSSSNFLDYLNMLVDDATKVSVADIGFEVYSEKQRVSSSRVVLSKKFSRKILRSFTKLGRLGARGYPFQNL